MFPKKLMLLMLVDLAIAVLVRAYQDRPAS